MTGLIILTFIPLVVAVGFIIRMRGEQKARRHAERRVRELEALHQHPTLPVPAPLDDHYVPAEWNAVLAHELRSPVGAILGYEELLEEGTFGELTPAAIDALRRIRFAATQIISVIEGLERSAPRADQAEPETVSAHSLIDTALDAVRFDADARNTTVARAGSDVNLCTLRDDALHALILALGAAIKASPGAALNISAGDGAVPSISIQGTRLDPRTDSGAADTPLTGPAFRLRLARATTRSASASIDVDAAGSVHLMIPRLPVSGPSRS